MSNQEVINCFKNGQNGKSSNGNLWISADGNRLYNYYTCIAQRLANGRFVVNSTKYSPTTSKIQTYVRNTLKKYREVTNMPMGCATLV